MKPDTTKSGHVLITQDRYCGVLRVCPYVLRNCVANIGPAVDLHQLGERLSAYPVLRTTRKLRAIPHRSASQVVFFKTSKERARRALRGAVNPWEDACDDQ